MSLLLIVHLVPLPVAEPLPMAEPLPVAEPLPDPPPGALCKGKLVNAWGLGGLCKTHPKKPRASICVLAIYWS